MMEDDGFLEAVDQIPDQAAREREINRTLIAGPGEIFLAGSNQEGNPDMVSTDYSHQRAKMEVLTPFNNE